MKSVLVIQFLLASYYVGPHSHGSTATMATSLLAVDCSQIDKCARCIQTLGCLWCADNKLKTLKSRCVANTTKVADCANIENPQGSVESIPIPTGHNISEAKSKERYQLNLRKGEKKNITIHYKDSENRPLDLYIMMDLSCSMGKHKEQVADLAESLVNNLKRNLTSNLQIGFGSFVDKPLPPFAYFEKAHTCNDKKDKTPLPPYVFQNHLGLTVDVNEFKYKVRSAELTRNVDAPEGTLEGLVQSVVCKQQIGWRGDHVRKLLVVATDETYHLAGDAKLLGIVLPHNGQCYVDSSGKYTHDAILDYPSLSVVRQTIRDNNIFVIFAVTKTQQQNYMDLTDQLQPLAVTQRIDDKKNITTVIEDEYRKLVNTVTLLSDLDSTYVAAKFYAKCPGERDYKEGDQCTDFAPGSEITFQIEVELINCSSSSNPNDWHTEINVYPQSSKEDNTNIRLQMLCGCACEHPDAPRPESALEQDNGKSTQCSNNGHLQCGICECEKNFGGPTCSCSYDNMADGAKCYTDENCNGRGHCDICGKCICNAKDGNRHAYSGANCECEIPKCVPGNTNNVTCIEGVGACVCNPEYTGLLCECAKSQEKCRDVNTNKICNGDALGECNCEKCQCKDGYKGKYCDIQYPQARGSCEWIKEEPERCVKCLVAQSNEHAQTLTEERRQQLCRAECYKENIRFDFRNKVLDSLPEEEKDTVCLGYVEDSNDCVIDFIVFGKVFYNKTILLSIESDEAVRRDKCPTPPPLIPIAIGVASFMVLIGIMLLFVWKVFTHIHDKKEYAQFEKSVQDAAWNMQNPLYIASTSDFVNPTFQQSETAT